MEKSKKTNQKATKKQLELLEQYIKSLEKSFKLAGITAVLHFPEVGVIKFFNSDLGRYQLLDEMSYEKEIDDATRRMVAFNVVNKRELEKLKLQKPSEKVMKYVG